MRFVVTLFEHSAIKGLPDIPYADRESHELGTTYVRTVSNVSLVKARRIERHYYRKAIRLFGSDVPRSIDNWGSRVGDIASGEYYRAVITLAQ